MIPWTSSAWTLVGPLLGLAFLVLTGALLVWDLEHPKRFWMVLARPQCGSWLVRGGFAITAYGALLAAHLGAVAAGWPAWARALAWAGGPLAIAVAVYTAYLLAQARARDLWQSPLLPPHVLVQALLAGSGALMLADLAVGGALGLGAGVVWGRPGACAALRFVQAGPHFRSGGGAAVRGGSLEARRPSGQPWRVSRRAASRRRRVRDAGRRPGVARG